MFGTMGFSELIIILLIILIIFGAGRLPQIGEGVGKALRGFKKEVHDATSPETGPVQQEAEGPSQGRHTEPHGKAADQSTAAQSPPPTEKRNVPYTPGPEMTPGTTASLLYQAQPRSAAPPLTQASASGPVLSMEDRAASPPPMARATYPPLPPNSHAKPAVKRPSAIVNKEAVARVQAQQAALKTKSLESEQGLSPHDMQHLGESIGDIVRTFQQTVADTRNSIAPHVQTIQAEMDTAQKELQQSLDAARDLPANQNDQPKSV